MNANAKRNLIVGIFVLLGLICTGYLTIKMGKLEIFEGSGYTVSARFSTVNGLRVGANVEIGGVKIGRVTDISLDTRTYLPVVKMRIQQSVELSDDVMAGIKTSGLIGDKYVDITPGGSSTMLGEGSVITDTVSGLDIESLISKFVLGGV